MLPHIPECLAENSYGQLLRCRCCGTMHLEFGNVLWRFRPETFARFSTFIEGLDVPYWSAQGATTPHRRKLLIDLPGTALTLALDEAEMDALRDLLREGQEVQAEEPTDLEPLYAEIETWLNRPPMPEDER